MTARITTFGTTADGKPVRAVHLRAGALHATILTHGARLQDLRLAGVPWPLTLGAKSVAAYEGPMAYFGAVVGPVANRIAGAAAVIDARRHDFAANEPGPTTLHSGPTGTHAQIWRIKAATAHSLTLGLDLQDGLGGFPGNRHLQALYALTPPADLRLVLRATSDAPSLMNLANHSYWNLDGAADTTGHRLGLAADRYLPVNARLIPTTPASVAQTGFDFRKPREIDAAFPLDHCFCLSGTPRAPCHAAVLKGARGVQLDLATNAPGLQVYDGRGLATAPHAGLTGQPYGPRAGLALEPQHWPDAAGRADFPSISLRPGQIYEQINVFSFTACQMA